MAARDPFAVVYCKLTNREKEVIIFNLPIVNISSVNCIGDQEKLLFLMYFSYQMKKEYKD